MKLKILRVINSFLINYSNGVKSSVYIGSFRYINIFEMNIR